MTVGNVGTGEAPRVDAHAHIYHAGMPLAATAWHRPPGDARVEDYLATLDRYGVAFGVLAAASPYGDYNDYSLQATRANQRLRTTVIVRPDIDRQAMQRMKEDGAVGVRLQWRHVAEPPDLDSPDYQRLLRHIADLDWHVQIHDDGWRLARPLAVLAQSGVKVVVDHFGRPDPAKGVNCDGFQAVLRALGNGRTWVKLSAGFRLETPGSPMACARELLKHAGADRLFWGSDWPFAAFESSMDYQQALNDLAQWVPDPAARRRIGSDNAYAFYFS